MYGVIFRYSEGTAQGGGRWPYGGRFVVNGSSPVRAVIEAAKVAGVPEDRLGDLFIFPACDPTYGRPEDGIPTVIAWVKR